MRHDPSDRHTYHRAKSRERREWGGLDHHQRDVDGGERERMSNKAVSNKGHRTDGIRRHEAALQIRELRARY